MPDLPSHPDQPDQPGQPDQPTKHDQPAQPDRPALPDQPDQRNPANLPDLPAPDPIADTMAGGLAAAFGGTHATDRPSVLRVLQQKAGSRLDLHLHDHDEPSDAPVRVDDETKALRDPSGRYQVLGEIGRGGVGVVYKGRDQDLGRDVAMKVLREEYAARPEILERFVEEAQIGGQLQHPGIVPVYEIGLHHGERPYFAMKLVKGETLASLLARRTDTAQDRRRLLGIFEQICQTIAYAHARRVVHRDLKPHNVMLGSFGEVQVVDWGLAKVLPGQGQRRADMATAATAAASVISTVRSDPQRGTHSLAGSTFGTPAYMPPEQALGDVERMDQRSDVFGLGAILCEVLTGDPPYRDQDGSLLQQAARADLQGAQRRIDACGADAAMIALCKQCLAPAPEARPESAQQVADAVGQYLSSVEERARQAQIHAAEARVRARSTVLLSVAALLLLTLGGGGYLYIEQQAQARRAAADQRVAAALNEANVRYGEARTATDTDLAIWDRALDAAAQAGHLAGEPDVGADARARVDELLAAVQRDRASAGAAAARRNKDAAMRQRLLEVRVPIDENTAVGSFRQRDAARVDAAYALAFRDHFDGADVTTMSANAFRTAATGDMLVELAAALDHWVSSRIFLQQEKPAAPPDAAATSHLQMLAMAIDPDLWRNRLRSLIGQAPPDRAQLLALQGGADLHTLPLLSLAILAQALWNVDAIDEARAVYLLACDRFPTDFGCVLQLGFLSEEQHDMAAAASFYRTARALRPDMREVSHRYGMMLGKAGDRVGSERVFRELLAHDPDNGHWHFHLGLICSEVPRNGEAVEHFEAAATRGDATALTWFNLGVCLGRIGRNEAAIAAYRKAAEVDPEWAMAHGQLGTLLRRLGRHDEAIECYRKAVALLPDNASARADLGEALMWRDDRTPPEVVAEARTHFEQAVAASPVHARAHRGLGYVLRVQRHFDAALVACSKAVELEPKNVVSQRQLAAVYEDAGRMAEAIAGYEKCLELDERHVGSLADLGNCYAKTGRIEPALVLFRKALTIDPNEPLLHFYLGNKLAMLARWKEAAPSLDEALRLGLKSPQTYMLLGICRSRLGEFEAAEAALRQAVALAPGLGDAQYELGQVYVQLDEVAAAIEHLGRAAAIDPDRAAAHGDLGVMLVAQNRFAEAMPHLRRAIELDPEMAPAHFQLGLCLRQLGEREAAIDSLRRAEALFAAETDDFSRTWLPQVRKVLEQLQGR